jgi:NAD(P)-dependent dehydrogenase (short-subunit alcohol dehydrogenase family)
LLTARTSLPPREAWNEWLASHGTEDRVGQAIRGVRDVEAAGGEVLIAAADTADEVAMRGALDEALARWGRLDGVVHAAGVSGNDRIALLKDPGDVAAVLAPKIGGVAALVRLLYETPLDFVALVSSMNSSLGTPGLSEYASANAVLDAFAEAAWPPAWRRVVAIASAPWREVGMAARRAEMRPHDLAEFTHWSMPPREAVDAFERAIASGRSRIVIAPFDVARADALQRSAAVKAHRATQLGGSRSADAAARAGPREETESAASATDTLSTDTERLMAAIWSELLGVDRIGADDDFFELGGHSLLATRVLARVADVTGVRVSLRDVFDNPTVRRLSARIDDSQPPLPAPDPGGEREELEF